MKAGKKRFVRALAGLTAAALLLTATGCGLVPKEEELPTAPVLVEAETAQYVFSPVLKGNVVVSQVVRCMYLPSSYERLSFSIGGEYIANIYVQLGQTVKAGDVLMELDVSDIDQQIEAQQKEVDSLNQQLSNVYANRELALEAARIQDQQAEELGTEGWTSKVSSITSSYATQIYSISSTLSVAQARLEELQEEKTERQLIAGIDGVVTQLAWMGERYRTEKDETVISISDMSNAMFEAYSSNADLLVPGETYTLECEEETYEVVAHLGSDYESETFDADKIYLEMVTPDPSLEKDTMGTVRIIVEQSLDTLYVQSEVIKEKDGASIVYILNDEGYKTVQEVTTGLSDGKVTEILSGLSEGDLVIVP